MESFQIYFVANDAWTIEPSLRVARRSPACAVLGSGNNAAIFVFGCDNRKYPDLASIERLKLNKLDNDTSEAV